MRNKGYKVLEAKTLDDERTASRSQWSPSRTNVPFFQAQPEACIKCVSGESEKDPEMSDRRRLDPEAVRAAARSDYAVVRQIDRQPISVGAEGAKADAELDRRMQKYIEGMNLE